jgi:hypothetical protein
MHTGATADLRPAMPGAPTASPLNMRSSQAIVWSGISRSTLYRYAGEGKLRMIKAGRTTLVDMESLRALLASLPAAEIRPSPKKAA